jgi:phage protein D
MDEKSILGQIHELVDEEHKLRAQVQAGKLSSDEEHDRLRQVEAALDQCSDLLRLRRSARERGEDPDAVQARSVSEVEGYLQ